MIDKQINKMPNWKVPGPDGVQGYWFNSIKAKRPILAALFTEASANAPKWLTTRKTVL